MSLRAQAGELLTGLRGPLTRAAMARELGMTRQGVMAIERGEVSLARLEALEGTYGVTFRLVAIDPTTGQPTTISARLAARVIPS